MQPVASFCAPSLSLFPVFHSYRLTPRVTSCPKQHNHEPFLFLVLLLMALFLKPCFDQVTNHPIYFKLCIHNCIFTRQSSLTNDFQQ